MAVLPCPCCACAGVQRELSQYCPVPAVPLLKFRGNYGSIALSLLCLCWSSEGTMAVLPCPSQCLCWSSEGTMPVLPCPSQCLCMGLLSTCNIWARLYYLSHCVITYHHEAAGPAQCYFGNIEYTLQ